MYMSSSSSDGEDGGNDVPGGGGPGGGGGGGADFQGPSTSRRRSGNGVWPEHFIEALASHLAIDASRSSGRLAAAPALFSLFQVCSTWRAVSRSDLLWQNLTRRIWNRDILLHDSWRDEYIYRHRTATNFRHCRYNYTTLHFVPTDTNNDLSCRRLALSDHHLAAGFSDGSVRLFHLPARLHLSTFHPHPRADRLGPFSSAVSGIILSDTQLVFASLDGDIHVVVINNAEPPRRSHLGNVVNDGTLVDFTGCSRWWVGLYAGVPGRAFHVWDANTEEPVFVGGTLTDPEAVMGWHLLTELTELVGRVRVTNRETAVACTSRRMIVFDLRDQGMVLGERVFRREVYLGSVDANDDVYLAVDIRGVARVRRVGALGQVCRFTVRGASQQGVLGCMNGGYALMCTGGAVSVYLYRLREGMDRENGEYLYRLRERIGEVSAIVADERHVAACSGDATIHLWDFGPQQ